MSAFPLHYTLLPIFPSGTCGELWAEATGGLSSIGCRFPAQRNAGKSIKGRNSTPLSRRPAFKSKDHKNIRCVKF